LGFASDCFDWRKNVNKLSKLKRQKKKQRASASFAIASFAVFSPERKFDTAPPLSGEGSKHAGGK